MESTTNCTCEPSARTMLSGSPTRRLPRCQKTAGPLVQVEIWQGLLRVVGSFGDCPRCLAVCPVGNDYHAHLADIQKVIPEKTPEKVALAKQYKAKRVAHETGAPA